MSYLRGLFVSIDQLGNALAGGDPDSTISARVGYFASVSEKTQDVWYWSAFQWIINTTFYPLDGEDHCLQAYYKDPGERYRGEGYRILYWLAAFIIIATCIPMSVIFWTLYLFGKRPKVYQSLDNIKDQLLAIPREIAGLTKEMERVEFSDTDACQRVDEVISRAQDLGAAIHSKLPIKS